MRIEELEAYEVIENRKIKDLNSDGIILKHKKTGARVALLSNDDENKVFFIGFRTPPIDSTGVAHIVEHTVLCGSDKYPIKDPFVELCKGSLNTFLNAMTYPDKTLYPVASCNDQDFQNLMDVYLDAVLHPNIYKEKKIFEQEGWHYECHQPDEELTLNGVVYNEMKGVFSSPDEILLRETMNSLYPDTTYGIESGGDPLVIPTLTYEAFLQFHKRYYHPSNSYIYLYGNMDMAEKLDYLDKQYLSHYDKLIVDSNVKTQPTFEKMNRVLVEYPIQDEKEEKESAYLSYNMSVADSLDKELYLAFKMIDYALCSAPGAPLKKALTDLNIGTEVYSSYEDGIKQPYFSIIAKNADACREEEFVQTIEKVLSTVVKDGFNKKALLAGINFYEFKYREADYGNDPKGLMYGLKMMDSWLYDEDKVFIHVESNETFRILREKVNTGYYEELVSKYLIHNTHKSLVVLKPKKGLAQQQENAVKQKLQSYKDQLSKEELQYIIDETNALKEYQESEDAEEDLAKIPLLAIKDMKKEANLFVNEMRKIGDTDFLFHPLFTNGISYIRLIFSIDDIPADLFPYVGIYKGLLGLVDTKNYHYADLFNEINTITGGMTCVNNVYCNAKDLDSYHMTFEIKTKILSQNLEKAISLMKEMILTSDFSDTKRIKEILAEGKSRMQGQMTQASHGVALNRALSYISKTAVLNEYLSGMDFYWLVDKLDSHYEDEKDTLVDKMNELTKIIFRPENLMVDLIGDEKMATELSEQVQLFKKDLFTDKVRKGKFEPVVEVKNEGFKTSGQVQFVCRAGNFMKAGIPYTGALKVLKVMLGYDYLWNQVRVKGGAYGCLCSFSKLGDSFFVSYRDPNLKNTVEVYEKTAEYLEQYKADLRTMTQFVIGAISDLDVPMNPAAKGLYSLSGYMTGITNDDLQKERDEIISCSAEDLSNTAKQIKAFMDENCLCVVGNAQKIEEASDLFLKTCNLI